jgi:2-C-methyl-D-erythritol 4-phosphate cytidylyltransferase
MTHSSLITAGGLGTRMGASVPKQYLELAGLPVLTRTLMAFVNHPLVDRIVLTVPVGQEDYCRAHIIAGCHATKPLLVVTGGPTRQASVYNGLRVLRGSDIVAIHDGVRPLVAPEIITRTFEAAQIHGAAVAAARVKDTVKRLVGESLETIPRTNLWLAHTPQTFRYELIMDAHDRALAEGFEGTDDASLVERLGRPVALVEDSEDNIKITTPEDLRRAERILGLTCTQSRSRQGSRTSSS